MSEACKHLLLGTGVPGEKDCPYCKIAVLESQVKDLCVAVVRLAAGGLNYKEDKELVKRIQEVYDGGR